MLTPRLPYWFLLLAVICREFAAASNVAVDKETVLQSEYDEPLQPSFIPELDFIKNLPKPNRDVRFGSESCRFKCSGALAQANCASSVVLDGVSIASLDLNLIKACYTYTSTLDYCSCCTKCGPDQRTNTGCLGSLPIDILSTTCIASSPLQILPGGRSEVQEIIPTTSKILKMPNQSNGFPLRSQILQPDWPIVI